MCELTLIATSNVLLCVTHRVVGHYHIYPTSSFTVTTEAPTIEQGVDGGGGGGGQNDFVCCFWHILAYSPPPPTHFVYTLAEDPETTTVPPLAPLMWKRGTYV